MGWAETIVDALKGSQVSLVSFVADISIDKTVTIRDLEAFNETIQRALREDGPWVIVAKIDEGGPVPVAL